MRFEVPQFIDIEDKIFGPLTWRQFIYVGGGGGIAVALFFIAPFIVFALVGIPVAALTFLLGFYPVNNQPFSIFLESAVSYLRGTKLYLWKKKGTGIYSSDDEMSSGSTEYTPPTSSSNLHSLSRKLELKSIQND